MKSPTIQFVGQVSMELSPSGVFSYIKKKKLYSKFERAAALTVPSIVSENIYRQVFAGKDRVCLNISIEERNRVVQPFKIAKGTNWCILLDIEVEQHFAKQLSLSDTLSLLSDLSRLSLTAYMTKSTIKKCSALIAVHEATAAYLSAKSDKSETHFWTILFTNLSLKKRHALEAYLDRRLNGLGLGGCEGGSSSLDDSKVEIHLFTKTVKGVRAIIDEILKVKTTKNFKTLKNKM